MPITSDTWWSVTCDSCMEAIGDVDGMTPLADSLKNAEELVSEYGGEIQHDGTESGRIVCSTCLEDAAEEALSQSERSE